MFALLTVSMLVSAQTRDLGSLNGCISDRTGAAVTSARISVINGDLAIKREVPAGTQGCFIVSGLPITGTYTITVQAPGFAAATHRDVKLLAGITTRADFRLNVSGAAAEVTVVGTPGSVQTESAQDATRLDLNKIDNTPVLSRKLSSLAILDSSVRPARGSGDMYISNTLFVVNGAGRRQVTYAIDNANADDSWGRQAQFTSIPFSTVEEFAVVKNALSAEYGRTTGAAVNIVTKSGTNNFHGDILGLWRPSYLSANLPTTPAGYKASEAFVQGGATVGGPIVRDRTYFLLSGEFTNQQRDVPITSVLDPGVWTGEYKQGLVLGRLDHQLNDNNSLMVRMNMDRLSDSNPSDTIGGLQLPSTGREFHRRTYAAQISERATISPTMFNEARFNFQLGSPIVQFDPLTPSTQFNRPGVGVEGESRYARHLNHQYQWADTLLMTRGRHNLKFGVDVIYSSAGGSGSEFGGGFLLGQFTVAPAYATTPLEQLTINDVTKYTQTFGNQNYNVKQTLSAFFVQDDFNLSNSLTLNLGLRYENQTFTDARANFAPRAGFAWRLPFDKTSVLRASYGIFYSELRANLIAGSIINGPEGVLTFQAAPGQYGFPTSLDPLPSFPDGAVLPARDIQVLPGQRDYLNQFFDVSKLWFYPDQLVNPYTQQWTLGFERELAPNWVLSLDYTGQHTIHIDRPVDLNAPTSFVRTTAGQVRSASAADATRPITPTNNGYRRIESMTNQGAAYYNGLEVKLTKRFSQHFSMLGSYTWSHSLATVDWDGTGGQQAPFDSLAVGRAELADSIYDQRHRAVISGWYALPWKFTVGTSTQFASGRPYNVTTGVDNNGDGVNNDRAFIDGMVVRRNSARSTAIVDIATFVEKAFQLTEATSFTLRAEAFNLLNHQNVLVRNGVYGNGTTPSPTFGKTVGGINNIDPGRQLQFQARFRF